MVYLIIHWIYNSIINWNYIFNVYLNIEIKNDCASEYLYSTLNVENKNNVGISSVSFRCKFKKTFSLVVAFVTRTDSDARRFEYKVRIKLRISQSYYEFI